MQTRRLIYLRYNVGHCAVSLQWITDYEKQRRYMMHLKWQLLISTIGVVCFFTGCATEPIAPQLNLLDQSQSNTYSDQSWSEVLSNYVRDGEVDYDGLSANPQALQKYYALLSVTGPSRTPDQFKTQASITAYWLNAYNALVLCAVLSRYPTVTMYDLSLPQLEYDYQFIVDGKARTLKNIEDELMKVSNGDVRILLATSRASIGTPALHGVPIQATILERQLSELAASALDNPHILRIDHASQSILVWQLIYRRQADFINYLESRRRIRRTYLYNVLMELASPSTRRKLQSAVGYSIRSMPFVRALNRSVAQYGVGVSP